MRVVAAAVHMGEAAGQAEERLAWAALAVVEMLAIQVRKQPIQLVVTGLLIQEEVVAALIGVAIMTHFISLAALAVPAS
jgi:hypothetical protein